MVAIGVDIGGTNVRAGVVTDDGTVLGVARDVTNRSSSADLAAQVRGLVARACEVASIAPSSVSSIGVGVPGTVRNRQVLLASNLPMINGHEFISELERTLDKPCVIDNDVRMAALSEIHSPAGSPSFVFVSIGTGIGACVVLDGVIVKGANNLAGEVGRAPLPTVDPRDAFHFLPLESVVIEGSSGSLTNAYGDRSAAAIAYVVSTIVWALDPVKVVLGGGVTENDRFVGALSEHIHVMTGRQGIVHRSIRREAAGYVGAAYCAIFGTTS